MLVMWKTFNKGYNQMKKLLLTPLFNKGFNTFNRVFNIYVKINVDLLNV